MAKGKYPRLEVRKISTLGPREDNPRRVTAGNKRLRRSLEELGNLQPITFNVRTGKLSALMSPQQMNWRRGVEQTKRTEKNYQSDLRSGERLDMGSSGIPKS